jgi:hypothetical protein
VIGVDGTLGARVTMPAGFDLQAVVDHLAVGIFTDGLDVESVQARRIVSR